MKKRFVALFSALAMILCVFPAVAEESGSPSEVALPAETAAAELAEASELNAAFSGLVSGEGYEITLTADNTDGEAVEGTIIAAVYASDDDTLSGVESFPVTIPAGEAGFSTTVSGSCDSATEYVKVFFWDSYSSMQPITETFRLEAPAPEAFEVQLSEANVWATDRQDDHGIAALLDDDQSTYMAGYADGSTPVSIYAMLDRPYNLSEISVGFHPASNPARSYSFDVEGSLDGVTYFPVLDMQTSDSSTYAPSSYPIDAEAKYIRVNVYGYNGGTGGWIRVSHLSLGASSVSESRTELMYEDFSGYSIAESASDTNWFAYALDEETYTDYTPSLGANLFAEVGDMPGEAGNSALHLYDSADRSSTDGAGAIGAFRRLTLPENGEDYTIKFRLLTDSSSPSVHWAGISLLSQPVTGGADLTAASALQLRLEAGSNGGAMIRVLDSVQFNEGSLRECFESEFTLGTAWNVTMEVSPSAKNVRVTVDDGINSETQLLGYNYTDVERVNNQTWGNTSVNYIAFNSGAGGMLDLYVDDLTVYYDDVYSSPVSEVLLSQDFESVSTLEEAGIEQAVVLKNSDGTTGGTSIGSSLQAEIADSGTFGSKVLKLTDTTASDGLVVGVPLTVPDNNNKYIIKWRMRDFNPRNYSGFSLASGFNRGFTDTEHPLALQLRYSMQSDGIQLNRYDTTLFNTGSFNAFMAGGGNRLGSNTEWNVSVEVNPLTKHIEITVTDGSRTLTASTIFSSFDSDGNVSERWTDNKIDTLLFHTSASGVADWIIDDIQVIDTGIEEAASASAVNGIIRLEGQWGTGKFLTLNGEDYTPRAVSDIDPNRTRFVERGGLMDSRGVSFESVERPGYYLVAEETDDEGHTFALALRRWENTAQFMAQATFYKQSAPNSGSYTGTCVNYVPIWDISRSICYTNTSTDSVSVMRLGNSDYTHSNLFYLRSEAVNYVSDNFKGDTLSSQWWTNYPWKSNNPTNDSYNFSALIDHRNIEVSDGTLLLKATEVSGWPQNIDGETGINYNGSYGKEWQRWAGRTAVISIQNKVYNRQSLIEGSFKQPSSPIGYWNAFWLAGRDSWPPEIDIFEFLSSTYGHTAWHTALHGENDRNNLFGRQSLNGINLTTGYHTFTLDWGYNYVKFYLDGTQFARGSNHDTIDFQTNMRLILNTGIGGWEKEPDDSMIWDDGLRAQWIRSFRY